MEETCLKSKSLNMKANTMFLQTKTYKIHAKAISIAVGIFISQTVFAVDEQNGQESTQVYFGDTHLHTNYSFDAFANNNLSAGPDTAYRFAKGQAVIHPYNRTRVQLGTPLDFLVVADHAEMLGVMRSAYEETAEFGDTGIIDSIKRKIAIYMLNDAIENDKGLKFFGRFLPVIPEKPGTDPVQDPANNIDDVGVFGDTTKIRRKTWYDIVDAAERHNDPGTFTSMIGWEWSSIPTGANLHRVIISPDGGDTAKQYLPYGSDDSQYPEDLWTWLDKTEASTGARFIAVPHNSNISKGYMFGETTLKGEPITAQYAKRRIEREPIVEATQIKGDSEVHPKYASNDEFADFEPYSHYIQLGKPLFEIHPQDYIRPTLKTGLKLEAQTGVNPYKFGLIGSTDAHTGLSSYEENNFWGKMARDSTPETKSRVYENKDDNPVTSNGWNMAAAGLAAVWAAENTREALFAAFKRKEVYATTGPRMRVRFFAGWDFDSKSHMRSDYADYGYMMGVPMGGDLIASGSAQKAPRFIVHAVKDPKGANLDRVQIVKGWLDVEGHTHEKIYDVIWSGNRQIDETGKLPAVGNTVDLTMPSYTNTIGAQELATTWQDPDFNAAQKAFYYVRVIEIPTPRHLMFDAVALGLDAPERGAKIIQERAYSSPIWYSPS